MTPQARTCMPAYSALLMGLMGADGGPGGNEMLSRDQAPGAHKTSPFSPAALSPQAPRPSPPFFTTESELAFFTYFSSQVGPCWAQEEIRHYPYKPQLLTGSHKSHSKDHSIPFNPTAPECNWLQDFLPCRSLPFFVCEIGN